MSAEEKNEMQRAKKNLFNFRPILFSSIFLAFGICFYYQRYFNGVSVGWLVCLLPLAVTPFFFCRKGKSLYHTFLCIFLLLVSFFVGYFGFAGQMDFFTESNTFGKCDIVGRVVEKRKHAYSTGLVLTDLTIDGKEEEGKLIAYLPASFFDSFTLSDEIILHGEIDFVELDGDSFSLKANDFSDGIRYCVDADGAIRVGHTFDLFLFLRTRAERVIDAGMDEDVAAVTKAVLFGDTSGIEAELYENIRYGGIAHIFAVSGLHIGALFSFCLLLLRKTSLRRAPKLFRWCLVAAILIVYAGICGFSPSVVRASVICLVSYFASMLRIKKDGLELLGIAAIFILIVTPSALFEVGFQLSFVSCFGIVFFTKPIGQVFDETVRRIKKPFSKKAVENNEDEAKPLGLFARFGRSLAEFLSTSLAAQIATSLIQLLYFDYVSGWALLLNCLFVPLLSLLFPFLLAIVVVACLLPTVFAIVVLYVPNVIWSALLLLFYGMDFSSLSLSGNIDLSTSLAYYAACLFLSDKWNLSKFSRAVFVFMCFCIFGVYLFALN